MLIPATVLSVTLGLVAMAGAKAGSVVSATHSSTLGEEIVVDAHGDTLYTLSGETAHHLLCKSKECFKFWPPLTVASHRAKLKAAAGVKGKLGLLRRKKGVFQVTLRGVPLYRFSGDHSPGQTNGQGIKSFGGTWFAATASHTHNASGAPGAGSPGGGGGNGGYTPPTGGNNPTMSTTSSSTSSSSSVSQSVTTTTTTTYSYPY